MDNEILVEKRRKNKKRSHRQPKVRITYTTGDPLYNIMQFNKRMGTDFANPSTEEAKKAADEINAAINGDTEVDGSIGTNADGDSVDAGIGEGAGEAGGEGGMGESLITEAKREVRRYYIRPQDIFCANKAEVIRALIDIEDENCSVYTLKNLGDEKDIRKLTTKDIIYYYDEGILYDKNHVRVMDYDLYIKHEEERKKFNGNVSDAEFEKHYEDRLTAKTGLDEELNEFDLSFDDVDVFGESINSKHTCCICGEEFEGYGNNPAPVKDSGVCCDACNAKFVIPARLDQLAMNSDDGDSIEAKESDIDL